MCLQILPHVSTGTVIYSNARDDESLDWRHDGTVSHRRMITFNGPDGASCVLRAYFTYLCLYRVLLDFVHSEVLVDSIDKHREAPSAQLADFLAKQRDMCIRKYALRNEFGFLQYRVIAGSPISNVGGKCWYCKLRCLGARLSWEGE